VGEGIGTARIFVVARAATGALYINKLLVNNEDPVWPGSWTALGRTSTEGASLVGAFGNKVAMAWTAAGTNHVKLSLLTPANGTWSPPIDVAAGRAPQLLWDGSGLHLLFVGAPTPVLRHASAIQATPLMLSPISSVSPLIAVKNAQYHATVHNERIHVALRQDDGSNSASRIFYTKSMTPAGPASTWSIPSETGIITFNAPRVAAIQHQIFVVGTDPRARIVYSARDMLVRGNDLTGNFNSDRWTVAGEELVDNGGEGYRQVETLSFNGDIYLTTTSQEEFEGFKAWIVNMSRAAVKRLFTRKLGMRLLWGEPGGGPNELGVGAFAKFGQPALHTIWPSTGEIPLIGDFNGDGSDDIARVTQKAESGVGPAPVYVSLFSGGGFQPATLWHRFFSLDTELPLVGDFNGDGKDDLVTFVQKPQAGIGPAPVWVSLSQGDRFATSSVWHRFFSLAGEVPMVGDVNGDGMDDIITFVQKAQPGIGSAPVWVALSQGNRFGPSQVWHPFFSLAGEVPMVGDVNGDGRDDILTFVQHPQANIGAAPVWVSLSQGNTFGPSSVWHTFFSRQGEIPRVADIDLDGRDDIVTFLHGNGASGLERVSFVALSTGSRFARSETLVSDFAAPDTLPFIGHFTNATLASITGRPQDAARRFPDLIAFGTTGWVNVSFALANYPLPSGAPWERYRWFTDKGIGAFLFPEWIWNGSKPCLASPHRLALLGQAGTGGGDLTNLSVRMGSRQGHVLEEVGHSIFANCFRQNADPFGLYAPIFVQDWPQGGTGASQIAAICVPDSGADYYDCRSADGPAARTEHIFLHHMIQYLVAPDDFRARIQSEPNPTYKDQLAASYQWLKNNWYNGLEFHRLPAAGAEIEQVGLQCGPGQC
jgi:FG-GAP-like repeat